MLESYITLLKPEVQTLFSKDSSGHDTGHLERTMNNALFIQKYEGGDKLVIGIAAYLHDIHRILQNEQGSYCSPSQSLPIIKELLTKVNLPSDKIEKVLHSIEYHEIYNWHESNNKVTDIETLILQDADNLDAIGAIGIARAFSYGGSHGIKIYDPNFPLNHNDDYSEEDDNDESTIHHFYHKLFKLGENMNTKIAKQISKNKTDFMKVYVDEFMDEWGSAYSL